MLLAAGVGLWMRTAGLRSDTLLGVDPFVHLRHLEASVAHWPGVQRYDVGTAFPAGQRSQVASLLHVLLALPCLLFGVEPVVALAWMPVACFFGALALVVLGAWRVAGPWGGALAAWVLVAWPGEFLQRTLLGAGDQHAVEALLVSALTVGCMGAAGRARVGWLVLTGAGFLHLWVGAALALAVVGLGWWACERDEAARRDQREVGVGWAAVAAMVGALLPDAVLRFDGAAAGVAVGLLLAWLASLASVRLRLLGLAVGAVAAWGVGGAGVLRYLAPRDTTILEQVVVTPSRLWSALGCTVLVAAVGWAAARRSSAGDLAALVALAWVAAWVGLRDFGYLAGPALALSVGASLPLAGRRLGWGLGLLLVLPWGLGVRPAWSGVADRSVLVLVDAPLIEGMRWLGSARRSAVDVRAIPGGPQPGGPAPSPPGARAVLAPWWFGHVVPTLSGHPVLWSHGIDPDGLRWLLGPGDEAPSAACSGCDAERDVGFVLLTADLIADRFAGASRQAGWPPEAWEVERLTVEHDGAARQVPVVRAQHDEARAVRLARTAGSGEGGLRLIWASEQRASVGWWFGEQTLRRVRLPTGLLAPAPGGAATLNGGLVYAVDRFPAVLIFEAVAGAQVEVAAAPGERVEASLSLRVPGGAGLVPLRWQAVADRDGRALLRLPHATGGQGPVEVVGAYRLIAPGRPAVSLQVSEAAVRAGELLRIGD